MHDLKKKIWIDLDNSPHVPFFKPIIAELEKRGYPIILTARNCFQVCELANLYNLDYKKIGRHFGKRLIFKLSGLILRSIQLFPTAIMERPAIAVSHGSRAQLLASLILKIPSISLDDYEYSREIANPTWMIMPEIIPEEAVKKAKSKVFRYPGIKEDVYVPDFVPGPSIRKLLKIEDNVLLVTIRPPATAAHYHNPESESLFEASINFIGSREDTCIVILPRDEIQKKMIKKKWNQWIENKSIIIPEDVVQGLNLIWYSDLIISGGGTMNREAAALGVPVYSIFRGRIGAVDKYLSDNGRLILLKSVNDISTKILLKRRYRPELIKSSNSEGLERITNIIESLL